MSSLAAVITNPYDRKARLQPALLSVLPILVAAVLLGLRGQSSADALVGVLAYGGVAMFLVQVGRDRGKRLEQRLFKEWGGKPSVALLRHRDARLSEPTKQRYRAFLDQAVPNLILPSAEEEGRDPEAADAQYQAATDWLIAQTRDRQTYSLLFQDNVTYGFRRNVWAFRPFALAVDLLVILALVAGYYLGSGPGSVSLTIVSLITLVHLIVFVLVTTRRWVRLAADAYALRLLECCDRLSGGAARGGA